MKCEFLDGHICQVILCLLKTANCYIVDSGNVNTTTLIIVDKYPRSSFKSM